MKLTYATDPADPSSPLATCSDNCPLAHDPSVPYQDFLFPEGTTLAGFQLNVLHWYGASGGLHLLQLLSEGSYAYAVADDNVAPCSAGLGAMGKSTVQTQGAWRQANVTTSIAGTTQDVLVADVQGGTNPSAAPSVTWSPAITQDGSYEVYFVTPGCTAAGTCAKRTSVQVTATPKGGSASETTVDQTNQEDRSTLIYNGTLSAVEDSMTVTMTLAPGGAPDAGRSYQLVADYINLVAASTNGSTTRIEHGYGLLEYALEGAGAFGDAVPTSQAEHLNASAIMTNATGFDALALQLERGSSVLSIVTSEAGSAPEVFVGGNFTYRSGSASSSNVLGYRANQVILSANGGLDGAVATLAVVDGALFAAGNFTSTADGAVRDLAGLAKWNFTSNGGAWEALPHAPTVANYVAQLARLVPAGGENELIVAGAGGSGLAFFDAGASTWNATAAGFFLGNLTAVASPQLASASSNATTYLAGNILAAAKSATPGGAILTSSKQHQPELTAFTFELNTTAGAVPAKQTSTVGATRRSVSARSGESALDRRSFSRVVLEARAPAPSGNLTLPTPISAAASGDASGANQVLAGAFWKNGSTDVVLVGGSFASSSGVANVGAYDSQDGALTSLPGLAVEGTVTTLRVIGDTLWLGGNFTASDGHQGLASYDLKAARTETNHPGLTGTGSPAA